MRALSIGRILCHAKKSILLFAFSIFLGNLSAENFRVRKLIPVSFNEITDKITVECGVNDALWVTLPEDRTYISGIELSLKIPEDIVAWRDSVAYMLYEKMEPIPSETNQSYYGERVHVATIPGNFSLTLHVPLSEDLSVKSDPYSIKIPAPSDIKDRGIFLRFMMVMKGVPESLENSVLEITAKPILKNQGKLALAITPQPSEEKKYSVFIDDKAAQDYQEKLLSTGEHHLSVVSDSFRNELRTFRIEQAKTTSLSIALRGIEPLIKISCPKDTKVYLDEAELSDFSEPLVITQGEHSVRFILGDYEIIKTVSAQNGRTYTVSLNVDASVSEDE